MASKRMSISALLSDDASVSSRPPSPAAVSPDGPPLKRQRHYHSSSQAYNQQYYDSYNAYPYTQNTSTTSYFPNPQPSGTASPVSQTWPPRPSSSHGETPGQPRGDDRRRYAPSSAMASSGPYDFARQHRETSKFHTTEDEEIQERETHWKPPITSMGESLVSVLTSQMRARQGPVALPAPPQLRHDSHVSHSHVPPTGTDSPPAAMSSHDISPIVKSTTPHATPPRVTPTSQHTSQDVSPAAYAPQYASPMTVPAPQSAPTVTMYPTQRASPTTACQHVFPSPYAAQSTHHTPQDVSPGTAYSIQSVSSTTAHTSQNVPQTYAHPHVFPPPQYTPPLQTSSYTPPFSSASGSYPPLPPKPPAGPPSSCDPGVSPLAPQSHSAPFPAAPPPRQRQLQPKPPRRMDGTNDRSFEDELLSLVDGDDVKPKILHPATVTPAPQHLPPEPLPLGHKSSGPKPAPAKLKATPKPRTPAKLAKAKTATARQTSGTSTPAPASSMPPPSPPLQPQKQQPAVVRAKGKTTASTGGNKKKPMVRSRSLSVKPPDPVPAPDIDLAPMARDDDRLYCVCKTPYDEDKVMIACDRCDEWYHPACVGMPEAEVDLVDQFICVSCAAGDPALQTTYKQRCHRGLNHVASHDALPPCFRPARGAFSKYCSDECGMAHMRAKFTKSGHDPAVLWPVVKNAQRREGVTVANDACVKIEEDKEENKGKDARMKVRKAMQEADKREMDELRRRLNEIMHSREEYKLALERVVTRRRLLDLAVEHAGTQFCGWDVRLEMGDTEWAEWIATEEGRHALDGREADDDVPEWRCRGANKCPRHVGWQNLRDLDVQLELDSKNASIKQLTDRERELRRRIEDLDPPSAPTRPQGKSGGRKKTQGKRSAR